VCGYRSGAVGSPQLRQLVVRFSEEELRQIRGGPRRPGARLGAWVGQTASVAAVATAADAGFAERAVVRALVEAQAGAGPRMTKWSLRWSASWLMC
jgi:hypothetical protein